LIYKNNQTKAASITIRKILYRKTAGMAWYITAPPVDKRQFF